MRLTLATSLRSLGHEVIIQASSVSEFLEEARRQALDAAVLDLNLGKGPTGIDASTVLRRENPEVGIVFLTSFEDPRLLGDREFELPNGAVYLVKREVNSISALVDAISDAVTGAKTAPPRSAIGGLTNTQLEILRLVALGASNSEIAKKRFITERSVETAISRIAKSLGIAKLPDTNQRVTMAKAFFRASGAKVTDEEA